MFALRSLARAVPRTTQFAARSASRQPMRIQPFAASLRHISPTARFAAPYSSSSGSGDDALVIKLGQELEIEKDLNNSGREESAKGLKDFLDSAGFKITDTAGEEEVTLTKKYNNETIKVTFSVADINNEPFPTEDGFGEDENGEPLINQQDRPNSAGRVAPEDQIEDAEVEDQFDNSEAFPAKLSVTVTKDGKPGALFIEALTQNGSIMVEDFLYFKDASLAQAKTPESEKKRFGVYAGPPFANLDEELQSLVETFLQDRGIDENLASFVAEYIDHKEQKEYVNWLQNVKDFAA